MTKVVFNNCFGGFSLSVEAGQWLLDNGCTLPDAALRDIRDSLERCAARAWPQAVYLEPDSLPRHHAVLVRCVQVLGEKANGPCAQLAIADIGNARRYRIDDFDGNETVVANDVEEGWIYL